MARTSPNGHAPSMSMSDFNERVRRILETKESVSAGTPRTPSPSWSRRRSRQPFAAAPQTPNAAGAEEEAPAATEAE